MQGKTRKKNHSLYDANKNGPYKIPLLLPGTAKAIYYCGILHCGRMAVTLALFLPTAECTSAFKSAKLINLLIRFLCAPFPSFLSCIPASMTPRARHMLKFHSHLVVRCVGHGLVLLQLHLVVCFTERVPGVNRDCDFLECRAEVVLLRVEKVAEVLPCRSLQVLEQVVAVLVRKVRARYKRVRLDKALAFINDLLANRILVVSVILVECTCKRDNSLPVKHIAPSRAPYL